MDRNPEQSKLPEVVYRLYQPAWYWSLAFLWAGFYVATSLYISAHRLLWFDEVFTTIICRQPNLHTMWAALCSGQDNLPPLYFVIARIFDQLFHHADIGIRVPSALGLGVGLLVIFDISRRLTDGLYGLIAMSFLTTSFVIYYGYEARPYALYFMLAAIALWLWLFTKEESKTATVAFGAVFLIGVAIHYYFVLCLVPFGLLALSDKRIFHPKVIAGAVGILCSLVMLYQQITSARHMVSNVYSWAQPTVEKLQGVYLEFFPTAILPLVLIALSVIVFGRFREHPVVTSISSGERLGWLFLAMPLAAYIVARLVTNYFYNRYIIGVIPGIVVAVTCFSWRHCRKSWHLSLALLVVFGGFGTFLQLQTLRHIGHIEAFGDHQERTRQMLALEDTLRREGKQRFAIRSALLSLEAWYYSKHPDLYWFILPVASTARSLQNFAPVKYLSVEEIAADAGHTAVINPDPDLIKQLEQMGHRTKIRFASPIYVLYLE